MSRGARSATRPVIVAIVVLFCLAARMAGTTAQAEDASTDQLVQRYVDQYGSLRCPDFDNQQQAQAVFDLDQIIFGDALDSNVSGIACDEEDFFSSQGPKVDPKGDVSEEQSPERHPA